MTTSLREICNCIELSGNISMLENFSKVDSRYGAIEIEDFRKLLTQEDMR